MFDIGWNLRHLWVDLTWRGPTISIHMHPLQYPPATSGSWENSWFCQETFRHVHLCLIWQHLISWLGTVIEGIRHPTSSHPARWNQSPILWSHLSRCSTPSSWFLKSQPKIIKSIYIVSNLAIRIHQKILGAKEALNCPWLCAFHNPKATFATVHIIDRFGSWWSLGTPSGFTIQCQQTWSQFGSCLI